MTDEAHDDETAAKAHQALNVLDNVPAVVPVPVVADRMTPFEKLIAATKAVSFLLGALAMVILASRVTRSFDVLEDRGDVNDCRNRYTNLVADGDRSQRYSTGALFDDIAAIVDVSLIQGREVPAALAASMRAARARLAEANEADALAGDQRDAWFAAGEPMPCPIDPTGRFRPGVDPLNPRPED